MSLLNKTLRTSHDWAVERIEILNRKNIDDAYAIQCEFAEWLDPEIQNHDIISLSYIGD
jgi:hypothetical protein